ncbi:MAG: YiiX/YebB-like N1pC/P60 family cysteine hydrolase [Myxococcota bacterium]|nr:YiiX/YebB-like N1pC/P60 family cysteine hydrolase [Myxococcota bacterium]
MKHRTVLTLLIMVMGVAPFASHGFAQADPDPCAGYGTSILVSGETSDLFLCKAGKSVENYTVAFGSKGLGKKKQGDRKTPVGTFKLGSPKKSRSGYKTFIPIRVPRRIGTAVGIHGPARGFRWLGPLNVSRDWTAGCIAMATDSAIDEVASFVRQNAVRAIHILPPSDWATSILKQRNVQLKTGDLIFQTSKTKVAATVIGTTGSLITHVGMVVMKGGSPFVIEAVGPVKYTPLNTFVRRGLNHYFSVKRLKKGLTDKLAKSVAKQARRQLGRRYDFRFRWSDKKQYCSELVYKAYLRGAGVRIGKLNTIGDLNKSWNPITRLYVKRAYGRRIPNAKESIITPEAMFDSQRLRTVIDTYPL